MQYLHIRLLNFSLSTGPVFFLFPYLTQLRAWVSHVVSHVIFTSRRCLKGCHSGFFVRQVFLSRNAEQIYLSQIVRSQEEMCRPGIRCQTWLENSPKWLSIAILSIYHLSIYLSIDRSIDRSIYLSIYLDVFSCLNGKLI